MGALVLFFLLTLLLFGLGFAVKALWWVAIALLVIWLIGLAVHTPERRWYRW